jgi:hypothetical protein
MTGTTAWEDLVTVALLGTDRRPLPDGPPPSWAGAAGDPDQEPTHRVLAWAAGHRAAVRAGSPLPLGPPAVAAPAQDRLEGPEAAQQELADALGRGAPSLVNDALAALADQEASAAPEHWTALATLAAVHPRLDRALLASALGTRGIWFVGQNPQWARLASALRSRQPGVVPGGGTA